MYLKLASLRKAFDIVCASRNNFRHRVAEFLERPPASNRINYALAQTSFVTSLRLLWGCACPSKPMINGRPVRTISAQARLVRACAIEFRHVLPCVTHLMAACALAGLLTFLIETASCSRAWANMHFTSTGNFCRRQMKENVRAFLKGSGPCQGWHEVNAYRAPLKRHTGDARPPLASILTCLGPAPARQLV